MALVVCSVCGKKVNTDKSNASYNKESQIWSHKKCPNATNFFGSEGKYIRKLIGAYKTACIKSGFSYDTDIFMHYVTDFYNAGYSLKFQYNYVLWRYELLKKGFVSYREFLFEKNELMQFLSTQKDLAIEYGVYDSTLDVIEQKMAINKAISEKEIDDMLEESLKAEDSWY